MCCLNGLELFGETVTKKRLQTNCSMLMDGSDAGFKNIQFYPLITELTGSDNSGPFFLLCMCYQAKKKKKNLAALETGFKLLADGWRQMKAAVEVFLALLSGPQTTGPCADTWMLVLQYHLTSGIYVSKFQLKPRKCQGE